MTALDFPMTDPSAQTAIAPREDNPVAVVVPDTPGSAEVEGDVGVSHASLTFDGGGLTLWAAPGTATTEDALAETQLLLQPDRPVVIGRQQGGHVPYLDPNYTPTHVLPDSGRSVLTGAGDNRDNWVSRGHFVLRANPGGVVLVNGVPRSGGGVRPPLNGTWLLEPEYRRLGDGEEYAIRTGQSAKIRLPNGTVVAIHAG